MNPYPLQGEYPAVPGNKPISLADITGPVLYAPIVVATPPTGGQVIQASAFGISRIETVIGEMGSDNGQYIVKAFLSPYMNGQPSTTIRLQWIVAATGAEAGAIDLSARTVRVAVIGLP